MTLRTKILIQAFLVLSAGTYCNASENRDNGRPTERTYLTMAAQPQKKPVAKKKRSSKSAKSSKPSTSADAKKKKRQTEQQLKKTRQQLKAAEAELTRSLRKVSKLESDIERSTTNSARLKARIDSITAAAILVKDSITANEAELQRLRGLYIRAVRSSRKNRREMNATTFIFSAETFRQAWRRMRYLEEFSSWRKRKTAEINDILKSLENQRAALDEMKIKVQNLRRESLAEERRLRTDKTTLDATVGSLKGKRKELNVMLKRQQAQLQELDRQIERLIQKEIDEQRRREAEEARRRNAAAAKTNKSDKTDKSDRSDQSGHFDKTAQPEGKQSGNFAAQKGRLPSPLSHTYLVVQGFGIQKHHSIKTLEVNNPGVDLETASGATARAVYPGTVSAIFRHEGLGHVVLLRHGEYLTVYANIANLKVAKGQKLKTGDIIGTVGASEATPNRGQLHFEIRHEREKINPMQWLKH